MPEDRRIEGLMMSMSVRENGTLAVLGRLQRWGFLRSARETADLRTVARHWRCDCPSLDTLREPPERRQSAEGAAGALAAAPSRRAVPRRSRRAASTSAPSRTSTASSTSSRRPGKAVILVSSELPELLRCCDRILVLREGRRDRDLRCRRSHAGEDHGRGHACGGARLMRAHRCGKLRAWWRCSAFVLLADLISPVAADGSRIFLQAGNLTDILRQISLIGIISLAMTFVILTGGIDLSVGSILALSTSLRRCASRALARPRMAATSRWPSLAAVAASTAGRGAQRRGHRDPANSAVHRDAGVHDRHARPGEMAHQQ